MLYEVGKRDRYVLVLSGYQKVNRGRNEIFVDLRNLDGATEIEKRKIALYIKKIPYEVTSKDLLVLSMITGAILGMLDNSRNETQHPTTSVSQPMISPSFLRDFVDDIQETQKINTIGIEITTVE